jgi:ribosomal protein S18 acetylase RimI-like enzyme
MPSPVPPIERATLADLASLVALEDASFATDRLSARQYRHHVRSPLARVLVARAADGGLAGSAVLFLRPRWRDARLYSIAVAGSARGQGLGAHLLTACEQAARDAGARRLRLEVRADNHPAIALYARAVYRQTGRRAAYYADGEDALTFERRLP